MNKQPASRHCFVCGRQNPIGLKLDFFEDADIGQVVSHFEVPGEYQGYPGVVHGGVIAAVLDEVSGRAIMQNGSYEDLMATLRLTIRYRRPTPTETPLTAVGWVERRGNVGVRVASEIRLADGTVTAECNAVMAAVPEEFLANSEEEKQYWKVYD